MPGNDSWNDEAWDDLLDYVQNGEVIPIVGGGLVTVANTGEQSANWLGRKLAESLEVNASELEPPVDVNQVVEVYFGNNISVHPDTVHWRSELNDLRSEWKHR